MLAADLVRSMLILRNERRTGMLKVETESTKTFVYLREGVPVFAEEGSHGETLGRLLVRQKQITQEQYVEVIKNMTDALVLNEQLRFGEVAVELGYLTEEAVKKALVDQIRWKIVRLFQRPGVRWELLESSSHLEEVPHFPMRLEALVLDAVRWIDDEDKDAIALLAARPQQIRVSGEELAALVERFALTREEAAFLRELDGKTVASALATEAAAAVDAPAILTAMLVTRAVSTTSEPKLARPATPIFEIRPEEPRPRVVPPPLPPSAAAAPPAPPPASPPAARRGPPPLPLERPATPVQATPVSAAPPSVTGAGEPPPSAGPGVRGPRPNTLKRAPLPTRASRILQALKDQRVEGNAERAPANEHEAKLLAERAFQDGLAHLKASRYAQASPLLQRASKLLPASDEYRLHARWASAQSSSSAVGLHPVDRAELKKLALAALKADPNAAFALYVAGAVARDEGDHVAAGRLLARAVKLDPDLLDAQRLLRMVTRHLAEAKKR